ncbi:polynucleotide kinase/phosphatase [Klebsiella phage Solomon]|uniref:Polynucleotide kinase/phosphatase n=1 Tax=Klebsiella phage Solomon TaxID=2767583 RepID=A0A873WJ42_9CAUD|nr:polynucleotide kinase/phosphatase [Klebsiella phage Solomon]
MNRKYIYIFDLDGTLSDGTHRLHLLPKKDLHLTESWTPFNMAAGDDAPIEDTIAVLNALSSRNAVIIILTGRSDEARSITQKWLSDHGVKYDYLIMRSSHDNRKDTVIKEDELRKIGLDRIVAAWDDSPTVIAHLRSLGITTYQVCDYGENLHDHLKSHGVDK